MDIYIVQEELDGIPQQPILTKCNLDAIGKLLEYTSASVNREPNEDQRAWLNEELNKFNSMKSDEISIFIDDDYGVRVWRNKLNL